MWLEHVCVLTHCPSLLNSCSFSSIGHNVGPFAILNSFFSLPSASYSLARNGSESLHPVWSPLCFQILIWVLLPCYKQPPFTSERGIFWKVRNTGRPHLKSVTSASPSFNDIWVQIWIQASQLDSSVPIHLSFLPARSCFQAVYGRSEIAEIRCSSGSELLLIQLPS